jgi:hypothetical protein
MTIYPIGTELLPGPPVPDPRVALLPPDRCIDPDGNHHCLVLVTLLIAAAAVVVMYWTGKVFGGREDRASR